VLLEAAAKKCTSAERQSQQQTMLNNPQHGVHTAGEAAELTGNSETLKMQLQEQGRRSTTCRQGPSAQDLMLLQPVQCNICVGICT
jgi:hypothetical protein